MVEAMLLQVLFIRPDRVGGGIAPAVLPHHRAYGSVPRRFLSMLLLLLPCLLSYKPPSFNSRIPPATSNFRPSYEASAQSGHSELQFNHSDRFSPSSRIISTTMPSADFCLPILSPLDDSSPWQIDRPPRVMHTYCSVAHNMMLHRLFCRYI